MNARAMAAGLAIGTLVAGAASAAEPAAASVKQSTAPAAKPGRWEISGLFGVRFFSDDSALGRDADPRSGSETANAVPFGARLGLRFTPMLSVEGEVVLMPTETVNHGAGVTVFGYRVHGLYYMVDESERLRPFVVLGLGGDAQTSDNDPVIDDGAVFLVHTGLGAKYRLGETWGARVDARYLLGPAYDGSFTAGHVDVLFSLYFGVGGKPAPRPEHPAPPPGPDDGDGDGISDDKDECPSQPEDADGHDDDDGCPEREEDVDGDGDGVLGSLDKCPKDRENENGYQDDDGCPDQPPAAVAEFTGTVEGISFKSGSATIARSSFEVLDRAAKVLSENPNLRVVITGHTDDRGKRQRNLALSLRRAEAVKSYLVKKGIADDRLEAIGRGPDEPLEDNTTSSGRARNRRIEFTIAGTGGK